MTVKQRNILNRIEFLCGNVSIPYIQRKFKYSFIEAKQLLNEYRGYYGKKSERLECK